MKLHTGILQTALVLGGVASIAWTIQFFTGFDTVQWVAQLSSWKPAVIEGVVKSAIGAAGAAILGSLLGIFD